MIYLEDETDFYFNSIPISDHKNINYISAIFTFLYHRCFKSIC